MAYGDDTEELSARLTLLTTVMADDLQSKLCHEIIKTLTAEERKQLVAWALKLVEAQAPVTIERAVTTKVHEYVMGSVSKAIEVHLQAHWKTLAPALAARVKEKAEAYATPDAVGRIVDAIVPPLLTGAVKASWKQILQAIPR